MTTTTFPTTLTLTGLNGLFAPELACRPRPDEAPTDDFGLHDRWVKGDLSSQEPDALASMISNWGGCTEDLILMVMIAISKSMDKEIKKKAEEVLNLRRQNEKLASADKNTEALDQAVQELQQMQKQRDQFFQMMQKILDGLTSSTDRLLQSWK
jgi:hypothetical protein